MVLKRRMAVLETRRQSGSTVSEPVSSSANSSITTRPLRGLRTVIGSWPRTTISWAVCWMNPSCS